MPILKRELLEMIAGLPDDEGEVIVSESTEGEVTEASAPTTNEIDVSTVEDVEVEAPAVEDDVVVITADDMQQESIDMRLATFYETQKELENTVKILIAEVTTLKDHFKTIETAIDVASETSPTVESIDKLINLL